MPRAYKLKEKDAGPTHPGLVTEMAIVNTFTKLIFGDEAYSTCELAVIDAFRSMEDTVSRDTHKEMGEYLRNLGVREMIQLVSRLRLRIADFHKTTVSSRAVATHTPQASAPTHGRETH